jgi:hypothetical protein
MPSPSASVVELVTERDAWCCVRCGRNVKGSQRGVGWSMQHRKARSMGGTSELVCPWINSAENLCLVCGSATTLCHGEIEENPVEAREMGYAISRISVHLPADVPVFVFALAQFVYLTPDGQYTEAREAS